MRIKSRDVLAEDIVIVLKNNFITSQKKKKGEAKCEVRVMEFSMLSSSKILF